MEGEIGRFRRRHLVPVPKAATLAGLNEHIGAGDLLDDTRVITGRPITVGAAFAAERDTLMPLPVEAFDPARLFLARVDKRARISVRQCYYSVPARYVARRLSVRLSGRTVEVFDGPRQVAVHERAFGRYVEVLLLDHYLEVLKTKPGGLPGATFDDVGELCAGGLQRGDEVRHDLLGLAGNVTYGDGVAVGVQGTGARCKNELTGAGHRCVGILPGSFAWHGTSLSNRDVGWTSGRRYLVRGRLPPSTDLSDHGRIDTRISKWLDGGHIHGAAQTVRFDQHSQLPTEPASSVRDPADMHHRMHSLIGTFGDPLVARLVDGGERKCAEIRTARTIPKVGGKAVAQRRHSIANTGAWPVPAEQRPELPADGKQQAGQRGRRVRPVRELSDQPR